MISPLTTWQVAALMGVMFVARHVHPKTNLNQKELRRGQNICIIPICSLFNKDPSAHHVTPSQRCYTFHHLHHIKQFHQNPATLAGFQFDHVWSMHLPTHHSKRPGYKGRIPSKVPNHKDHKRPQPGWIRSIFFHKPFWLTMMFSFLRKKIEKWKDVILKISIYCFDLIHFCSKSLVFFDVLCGSFEKNGPNTQGLTSAYALVCSTRPVQPWHWTNRCFISERPANSLFAKWLLGISLICV